MPNIKEGDVIVNKIYKNNQVIKLDKAYNMVAISGRVLFTNTPMLNKEFHNVIILRGESKSIINGLMIIFKPDDKKVIAKNNGIAGFNMKIELDVKGITAI